jgi:hypothetical protein
MVPEWDADAVGKGVLAMCRVPRHEIAVWKRVPVACGRLLAGWRPDV